MTDTTDLRRLAEAADYANPGWRDLDLRAYLRIDGWIGPVADYIDAAVVALPALLDERDALLAVAEAAREYIAHDGSGIKDPDPRWRGDYSARQMLDARAALRAALDALEEGK